MEELKLEAFAKINLSLDVIGKKSNGYHEVRMIMQQVDLKDNIYIKERDEGIKIECTNPKVPTDSSNLVYKAYDIIKRKFNINKGVEIKIEKNIPMAAGLAGGSSDCAQVLIGLNKLWNLGLSEKELMEIGVKIGADVPYCIMGGTALAEGIGEKLTKIKGLKEGHILLAKPNIDVSTAYVYKNLEISEIKKHPDIDKIIKDIEKDIYSLSKDMVNVLETVTIKKHPEIKKIKEEMIFNGALGSLMSGSGPTVFGIFDDIDKAKECKKNIEKWIDDVYLTEAI